MIVDELRKLQVPLQDNLLSNFNKWVGLFFNFHILLGVRGLRDNGVLLSYDVLHDRQLGRIPLEDECLVKTTLKPVRILVEVRDTLILHQNRGTQLMIIKNKSF